MAPHYHYSHGAEPGYPGFDVDLGAVVTVGIGQGGVVQTSDAFPGLVAAAMTGDTAQSTIILDDPNGNLGYGSDSIVGLHRFYMSEDLAASSDNVAWNGYINAREYRRGESMGITPIGAARRITVDLSDDNAILRFRLATGSDANRPAERAGQRLSWLLGTNYLGGVNDHGLVAYPCNAMDATNYQGQYGGDILADIAVQTGYNYWARYRQASSDIELWFDDANTSTNDTCGLQISNVAADIDNTTTFAPSMDAVLRRDPSKVYAGVYLPYAGSGSSNSGSVYVGDYNISYQYGWRDGVAPNANIHTRAQATAAANQLLKLNKTENDLVTVGILLPQSLITSVKQGQRMQVKFTHLPGYENWIWCRILRKTISRPSASDTRYLVTLEMTPQQLVTGLHQVVLISAGSRTVNPLSTYTWTQMVWTGGGTPPRAAVFQDTDGYASGDSFGTITIPKGLGGTYLVTFETINTAAPWLPTTISVVPAEVAYTPGGVTTSMGIEVPSPSECITVAAYVNGAEVLALSSTACNQWTNPVRFSTSVTLNDGDVITTWVYETNSVGGGNWGNAAGAGALNEQAVFVLTRTGN